MWRMTKYLFRLALLGAIGLVTYALLADLPPPTRQITVEVPMPGASTE